MKLNGKYYLIKKIFSYLIDDLILDVELSNTNDTSVDLEDLNSNDIDNVIDLLLRLKNQIFALCSQCIALAHESMGLITPSLV